MKQYDREVERFADGSTRIVKVILRSLNPDFPPLELTPAHEMELRAIAEFVEVMGKCA